MKFKPILIVAGEPNSVFFEIFFKSLKKSKIKSPLILIASEKLLRLEMQKFNFNRKIKLLDIKNLQYKKLDNKFLNLININYKNLNKMSLGSNKYIYECFETAFNVIKQYKLNKFINGPVNKNKFLDKKFYGITEYISHKFNIKKHAMLIYNEGISVCPVTTHLPLKNVAKKINKKLIIEKTVLFDDFYKKKIKKKTIMTILG